MDHDSLQNYIDDCKGFCVEIGGPSPGGYDFLKELSLVLPAKILVTNISNPIVLNPHGNNPEIHRVDAIVDIRHLPYENGKVDMIMTSSLPHSLHRILFKGAGEVLRSNGLLIIENELPEDLDIATKVGFKPLLSAEMAAKYFSQIYQLRR